MAATFVVEDGSGKSNANSYASEAAADQEVENLETAANVTIWLNYASSVKQAALRDATAYADQRYGRRWLGLRWSEDQALDWPRSSVQDYDGFVLASNEIPAKLVQAVALLAVKSAGGTSLWADQTTPGTVRRKKVKAGPVEQDIEYTGGSSQAIKFPRIDALVSDYVEAAGRITRA